MTRSHRLAAVAAGFAAVVLVVTSAVPGGWVRSTEAAAASTDVSAGVPVGVPYQLEGFAWPRRGAINVYYTWDGGPCVIDGSDLSGPPSQMTPALALQTLQASLQDVNLRLGGGLRLIDAGPVTQAELCSTNASYPIVVGFGNIGGGTEAGLTLSFSLQSNVATEMSSLQAARVFISDTFSFACPGVPVYRDLQHTMTHELLHAIGVGHSSYPGAIMAASSIACQSPYLLQPDDLAALVALYPPPAPPPSPGIVGGFASASIASASGQTLTVFNGGSVDQLEGAAAAASASGVWVQDASGTFQLLVVGGPDFLRNAFKARFPRGFPGATAVTLIRATR